MERYQMNYTIDRKLFGFLLLVFLLSFSSFSHAERMYLTFLAPDGESLQKSDLTLKLDKKDLPVAEFLAVNISSPTPEVVQHPAGRRHYVFLYDLVFGKPEDLVVARKTTEAFLKEIPPTDLIAVASISKKGGLQFLSGFSADRQKIYAGMNVVGLEQAQGVVLGPEGNFYKAQFAGGDASIPILPAEQFMQNVLKASGVETKKEKDKQWAPHFVQALTDLAYNLSAVDGRKDIVLFSPGFETEGVRIKVSEKGFSDEYVDTAIRQDEVIPRVEDERMMAEEKRKLERDATPQLPPVQVEGIPEFVSAASCSVHILSSPGPKYSFYKSLAEATGGAYLEQGSDVVSNVRQILDSDPKFYVIGFDGKTEKEFKNLHKVSLEAPGKKLIAPASWIAPRPYSLYTPLMKRLHLSEAVYKDYEKPNPAYRFWSDFVYDQGSLKVPIFAQLSGPEVLKQDVQELGLEFYGFLIDANGTLIDFTYVPVRVDLKNKTMRERLNKSGIKIWGVLLGQKGPVTVRTVLINREYGDTFTYSTKLDIKEQELITTNPFFPDVNLDWMVWPTPEGKQSKRGVSVDYPYTMGTNTFFFPNLNPKIKLGETGQVVYFRMYHLLPESKNPPIKLELVGSDGKSAQIEKFGLLQKPKILEQGGMELFWKLTGLPQGMSPGPYRFLVQLKDTAKNKDINHVINMEVQ